MTINQKCTENISKDEQYVSNELINSSHCLQDSSIRDLEIEKLSVDLVRKCEVLNDIQLSKSGVSNTLRGILIYE